jgi:DNA-binding CsgD family transcriptional regulator
LTDGFVTKREAGVVRWAVEGLSNREIARKLGLAEHTVKNYLFRVFDKLGVSNRVELVLSCLRQEEAAHERQLVHLALSITQLAAPTNIAMRSSTLTTANSPRFTRLERLS